MDGLIDRYTVSLFQNDTYEVLDAEDDNRSVFQGTLADCEALIRLLRRGVISV